MKTFFLIPWVFLCLMIQPMMGFCQGSVEHEPETWIENSSPHAPSSKSHEQNAPEIEVHDPHDPITKDPLGDFKDDWEHHFESGTPDDFQAKFFHMLYILALLIGFMMLASWSIKRLMKNKMTNLNTSSNIKVLETRYLSPRATLYVIEIEGKTFLIGESPSNVSYLSTISHEEDEQKRNI